MNESCRRESDHLISAWRPRVMFRVDSAAFEFNDLSVREIVVRCYEVPFRICI